MVHSKNKQDSTQLCGQQARLTVICVRSEDEENSLGKREIMGRNCEKGTKGTVLEIF